MNANGKPNVVLDLSSIVWLYREPGELAGLVRESETNFWIPLGFFRFLRYSNRDEWVRIAGEFGVRHSVSELDDVRGRVSTEDGPRVFTVSRRKLEAVLGQGAFERMRDALRRLWRGLGLRAEKALCRGFLEIAYSMISGPGGGRRSAAAVLSVGKEPDGENPSQRILKEFGQTLLSRVDPIFQAIGPAAEAWEARKVLYVRKLFHPTRAKLASEGLAVFLTIAAFIVTANPWGVGAFFIVRAGDFAIDGGLGTQPPAA